jgi:hypothetical protein
MLDRILLRTMPLSVSALATPLDVLLEPSPGYGPAVSSGMIEQVVLPVDEDTTLVTEDADEDDEDEDIDAAETGMDVPPPPPPQLPSSVPAPSPPSANKASRRVRTEDFPDSAVFCMTTSL